MTSSNERCSWPLASAVIKREKGAEDRFPGVEQLVLVYTRSRPRDTMAWGPALYLKHGEVEEKLTNLLLMRGKGKILPKTADQTYRMEFAPGRSIVWIEVTFATAAAKQNFDTTLRAAFSDLFVGPSPSSAALKRPSTPVAAEAAPPEAKKQRRLPAATPNPNDPSNVMGVNTLHTLPTKILPILDKISGPASNRANSASLAQTNKPWDPRIKQQYQGEDWHSFNNRLSRLMESGPNFHRGGSMTASQKPPVASSQYSRDLTTRFSPAFGFGTGLQSVGAGSGSSGRGSTSTPASAGGLVNLGNTCFFNAVLQSIRSVEKFVEGLALVQKACVEAGKALVDLNSVASGRTSGEGGSSRPAGAGGPKTAERRSAIAGQTSGETEKNAFPEQGCRDRSPKKTPAAVIDLCSFSQSADAAMKQPETRPVTTMNHQDEAVPDAAGSPEKHKLASSDGDVDALRVASVPTPQRNGAPPSNPGLHIVEDAENRKNKLAALSALRNEPIFSLSTRIFDSLREGADNRDMSSSSSSSSSSGFTGPVNPRSLLTAISKKDPMFGDHMQHDAHEFWLAYVNQLHDALLLGGPGRTWVECQSAELLPTLLFDSELCSRLTCPVCAARGDENAWTSEKVEKYRDYSLHFPEQTSTRTSDLRLEQLFAAYFEPEQCEYACERCRELAAAGQPQGQRLVTAQKKIRFPAKALALHLKRFKADFQLKKFVKRQEAVHFPEEFFIGEEFLHADCVAEMAGRRVTDGGGQGQLLGENSSLLLDVSAVEKMTEEQQLELALRQSEAETATNTSGLLNTTLDGTGQHGVCGKRIEDMTEEEQLAYALQASVADAGPEEVEEPFAAAAAHADAQIRREDGGGQYNKAGIPIRIKYRISSVVAHLGDTPYSGHYITWNRRWETDTWTCYNDTRATEFDKLPAYVYAQAYMLLYQQVEEQ